MKRKFEIAAANIHRKNPYYVPPFPGSITKILGPKGDFSSHGEIRPFIALKDGEVVGRIATTINHSQNEYTGERVGFFGYFDFIEDFEIANALFKKATEVLNENTRTSIRGPYNPSIHDECGLLVDGFEAAPAILMPYNPPYYLEFYEKLGLKQALTLHSYYMSANSKPNEVIEKIANRVKSRMRIKIREVELKNLQRDLQIIRDLYNVSLNRNWGFYPVTMEDMEHAAKDLKDFVKPEMCLIAEIDSKPVGYSLCLPNINEFLLRTKQNNILTRVLKFVWLLKTSHPKETRLAAMGVAPEHRSSGLAAVFYYEALIRAHKLGLLGGELGWVEETNQILIKSLNTMGAKQLKSYSLYEKELLH